MNIEFVDEGSSLNIPQSTQQNISIITEDSNTVAIICETDQNLVINNTCSPCEGQSNTGVHNSLQGLQGGSNLYRYHLDQLQWQAITAANNPSAQNPIATLADLGNIPENAFENGLEVDGNTVRLGGPFTQDTQLGSSNRTLYLNSKLAVNGSSTQLNSTLSVSGATTINNSLDVTNTLHVQSTSSFNAPATFTSGLTSGNATFTSVVNIPNAPIIYGFNGTYSGSVNNIKFLIRDTDGTVLSYPYSSFTPDLSGLVPYENATANINLPGSYGISGYYYRTSDNGSGTINITSNTIVGSNSLVVSAPNVILLSSPNGIRVNDGTNPGIATNVFRDEISFSNNGFSAEIHWPTLTGNNQMYVPNKGGTFLLTGDAVDTTTNQTNILGNKEWKGSHTWTDTNRLVTVNNTGISIEKNTNNENYIVLHNTSTDEYSLQTPNALNVNFGTSSTSLIATGIQHLNPVNPFVDKINLTFSTATTPRNVNFRDLSGDVALTNDVNNAITQHFLYKANGTEGNNITNTSLIGVNIVGIYREGIRYTQISSGTPVNREVIFNTITGNILFADTLLNNEVIDIDYSIGTSTSISTGVGLQFITTISYANMIPQLTGGSFKIFYVQADEVNGGGLPTEYLYFNGNLIRNIPQQII